MATEIAREKESAQVTSEEALSLCLSGGGFRATLFHLGVVRALREQGLLGKVRCISSVSGGSILAAHIGLHWEAYNGTDEEFEEISRKIIWFAQHDIRGRITRRLPYITLLRLMVVLVQRFPIRLLPQWANRRFRNGEDRLTATGLLESYYDLLYQDRPLSDLSSFPSQNSNEERPRPVVYILGTTLGSFQRCSFSHLGLDFSDNEEIGPLGADLLTVSKAVAASSAYPAFFPAVRIRRSLVEGLPDEVLYISDGAVYDNLGISLFLDSEGTSPYDGTPLDRIVCSDATGEVDWSEKQNMNSVVTSGFIAIDGIMRRSRDLLKSSAENRFPSGRSGTTRIDFVSIRPEKEISRRLDSFYQQLKYIRTDLDRFSDLEISGLVHMGYAVAKDTLGEGEGAEKVRLQDGLEEWQDWPVKGNWDFNLKKGKAAIDIAGRFYASRERKARLFSSKDPLSWFHVLIVCLLLTVFANQTFVGNWIYRFAKDRRVEEFLDKGRTEIVPSGDLQVRTEPVLSNPYLAAEFKRAFEVFSDHQIVDLREWTPSIRTGAGARSEAKSEFGAKPSYVTLHRFVSLKKKRQTDRVAFTFRTGGDDIRLRGDLPEFPDAPAPWVLSATDEGRNGENGVRIRQIVFDVRDIEIDTDFSIEMAATFVNGFQRKDQWWVGILSLAEISGVSRWWQRLLSIPPRGGASMLVVFPHDRPFKWYDVYPYTPDTVFEGGHFTGKGMFEMNLGRHISGEEDGIRYIYLHVPQVSAKIVYAVGWDWAS